VLDCIIDFGLRVVVVVDNACVAKGMVLRRSATAIILLANTSSAYFS
jgi:hypothetical protein